MRKGFKICSRYINGVPFWKKISIGFEPPSGASPYKTLLSKIVRTRGEDGDLTDGRAIHLHSHARFVVPFHWYETNKMRGDRAVQVVFDHLIGVSVSCELL